MNVFILAKVILVITLAKLFTCELCELKDKQGYKIQFGKDNNGTIHFVLSLSKLSPNSNSWYAIGFGRSMLGGLDVIMIRILNGRVFVTDEFVNGYTNPIPDIQQDVTVSKTNYVDGTLTVRFSRPSIPTDKISNIPLRNCFKWNFVMNPGTVYDNRGSISKHPGRPFSTQVCLDQCLI